MSLGSLRTRYDDRLDDDDRRGCGIALAIVVLVCVASFLAWREAYYMVRGRTTDAEVLRVYDVRGNDSATIVDYEFVDPATGARRRHSDHLPLGWQCPPGPLRVEFVPGAETYARVAGQTQRWSLWVLCGSLLAAGIYLGLLIREANTPIQRMRRYNRDQLD